MTRFLLIRHAANDTIGKSFAGRMAGVNLNEFGKMQADQLAEGLAGVQIEAVYTSPLERAIETARPLSEKHDLKYNKLDDLSEIDCGDWTGKEFGELRKEKVFERFNTFRSGTRIPGGELMLEAQVRMVTTLEKLFLKHPAGSVAIVGHADPIKGALAYFAGIPLDLASRIEISPASISVLELYEDEVQILFINYTGDLEVLK
jgi:broad specificity phosphatase PhoE